MERGRFYQQFGEKSGSGEAGSARQFVSDLIQRQGLRLPDVYEYNMMWSGLAALTIHTPLAADERIGVTPEIHRTIVNVSRGLDFVLFNELGKSQKGKGLQRRILAELTEIRQEEGTDRLVLPYEEGLLLRDAAAAVNIAYDPGEPEDTPENVKKRTFVFADLEGIPLSTPNVIDADK
jgi:hypothetical protein